ncbi:MAG TPA: ABC transporter permease [Thermoanaerobaculia bacterium]|nr:ABC transporter permease [Thermoanaerobaculia bacterium]
MIADLANLFRYRQLIASLTSRDLKARYRGSVLGFFWSLANPLLLLGVYTLVFTWFFPRPDMKQFWLFLFTGILPWTFFAGSVLESTGSIIGNAGLVKKVLFPAEALPIVVVLSHLVHFMLALPILLFASVGASLLATESHVGLSVLLTPLLLLLQLIFVAGIAMAISSSSVLFRDLRDLIANVMHLWFFLTPIIYALDRIDSQPMRILLRLNPMTPFVRAYQSLFYYAAAPEPLDLTLMGVYAFGSLIVGLIVFERLRDTLAEAI